MEQGDLGVLKVFWNRVPNAFAYRAFLASETANF